jgi:hypothetical protein
VNNGETIYKHDYQANTDTPYTIFKAAGKLKKHTKHTDSLGNVKNIPLDYWDNGTNYRVVWKGSNFEKIAQMPSNCSDNCTWTDITTIPTPTINFSQVQWSELNFWSQSLGGQVRVPLSSCTFTAGYSSCSAPDDTTSISFYQEDIVYPTDAVPSSFLCYDNCPQAVASGISTTNPTYSTWDPSTGQSIAHTYSFSTGSMLLMDGANPVISTTTSSTNQWGYMSGALVSSATPSLSTLLACDWNPGQICGYKAWSVLDVFYTWETGPNTWNQFTAIKDVSDQFVIFQPPLQVEYVHSQPSTSAPDYKFNNTKFFLDYSGFGQLNGIPAHCVNMDTGANISCSAGGNGASVRWVPEFFIPAGSPLGSSNEYVAKPLQMEQRMRETTGCAGAGLATQTYTLPSITTWVNPAIGAEPVVTAAPAVIGGVVQ